MVAQGTWAQAGWPVVYAMTNTPSSNWTALNDGSTTRLTIGSAGHTTYYYANSSSSFTNTTVGGIVGSASGSQINMTGCVFSGLMTGAPTAGAFIGLTTQGNCTFTDCLYLMADGQNTKVLDLAPCWWSLCNFTRCYKTTKVGSQGTYACSITGVPVTVRSLTSFAVTGYRPDWSELFSFQKDISHSLELNKMYNMPTITLSR